MLINETCKLKKKVTTATNYQPEQFCWAVAPLCSSDGRPFCQYMLPTSKHDMLKTKTKGTRIKSKRQKDGIGRDSRSMTTFCL